MIKATAGEELDRWIHRLFPFLFWWPLDPNALTVIGSGVSIAAALALADGALVLGGCLVLAGGFFDLVDGVVARAQGISTAFGGFLDSTLDRLVDVALLFGLGVYFARTDELWAAFATGVALVTAVLTSYAKARAELVIGDLQGGLLERGERIGLIAAGAILGFPVVAAWLLALGGVITVAQRMSIAYRRMAELDADEAADVGSQSAPPAGESEDKEGRV